MLQKQVNYWGIIVKQSIGIISYFVRLSMYYNGPIILDKKINED